MSPADIRTIAAKDLRLALHRRGTIITIALLPILVTAGLGLVLHKVGARTAVLHAVQLPHLLDAFIFFFVIIAATIPTGIAAYALVGEKVERSLEPLLATPVRDIDILVGKFLAAWLPAVLVSWVGASGFMALADMETRAKLGYNYFPNSTATLILLALIPMAAALSVAISVLVSTRAVDVRTAQQIGSLPALPFGALYVMSETGLITLDTSTLWWVGGILLALVVGLLGSARAVFNREGILTNWK